MGTPPWVTRSVHKRMSRLELQAVLCVGCLLVVEKGGSDWAE
jgi:hypothetical protein